MNTYSVRQIAEILGTNPETVRRWIRDGKLKAVQVSRKNGNVVTEAELERFINLTPKYSNKLSVGLGMLPFLGIGALAGSIMTSVILAKYNKQEGVDVHIRPEDLKASLQERTKELQEMISRKQELIHQTEAEIEEITKQIKQYNNFIENEALLADETKETTINMGG